MAGGCSFTACACTTTTALSGRRFIHARWSGNWKSCGTWASTPSAPATTRRRRNCLICATGWDSSCGTSAFDKWDATADRINGQPPLEQYGEKQIRNLVMRDRNHPCVVVWSIGNEIGEGGRDGVTPERVKFMSEFVRKYDPTRPVGMACHIPGMAEQPNFDALDLTGWNYGRRYATYRQRYPDKPIIYSESASALSTRGFYELPLPK